jgi:hypothetical protein
MTDFRTFECPECGETWTMRSKERYEKCPYNGCDGLAKYIGDTAEPLSQTPESKEVKG